MLEGLDPTPVSPENEAAANERDCKNTLHARIHHLDNVPWRQRPSIKIEIRGLPPGIDAYGVWNIFKTFGNIDKIEIKQTSLQPSASIIFKPPPAESFWDSRSITIPWKDRSWRSYPSFVPWSSIRKYETTAGQQSFEELLELTAVKLEFGVLYTPESMKSFHTVHASETSPISLRLDLSRRRLEVEFPQSAAGSEHLNSKIQSSQNWQYRFIIPFTAPVKLLSVDQKDYGNKPLELIIQLDSPPEFSRRYAQKDSHQDGSLKWDATIDPWYRSISLRERGDSISNKPTSLSDLANRYRIGRWITYKITLDESVQGSDVAEQLFSVLETYNITVQKLSCLQMITREIPSVFGLLDSHPQLDGQQQSSFAQDFADSNKISLDFPVRYQLEVCISEGWLCEYRLDRQFLENLKAMDSHRARGLLIGVAAEKKKIFDPMSIFQDMVIKPDRLKLPNYCFYARSVTVTPTTMYVATPSLDVSNRVIRRYREQTDRFLRVRFAEERPRGKLYATFGDTSNMLYMRIKHVLMNGIVIGDRHYQFLAFGNSQLREHTAYFFCSTAHLTCEKIRSWMGDFDDKVVAKYAARLGQCFSTTRAVIGANIRLGRLDDFKTADGKFNFTDGVGMISEFMAKIAANELGVLTADGRTPSALQFRLGGCKGVLAIWPSLQKDKIDIRVRRSQEKFRATYQGLEIIRWSNFSSAYLNRQLITILTTLGVKDDVFVEKLEDQLSELDESMTDPSVCSRLLQRDVDPNQMSLELAAMVKRHFQLAQEPFMLSVLQLWRAYTIKYLKEKARILIHKGANLLGVIDELGVLRGHFDADQLNVRQNHDVKALPEIFIQLSNIDGLKGEDRPHVIEGVVLLARNPSLHPGDIRVVRAVDNPQLHHLRDVVVLPKTGDRDLASMCSGGDLDGDDYVVIWDQSLIPREWNHEPMDFTPPPPLEVGKAVTVDDITSFFVQYVKNDALPSIAHAHLAWADQSDDKAHNFRCLELADLHSIAVDYPKSGHAAVMAAHLRPKEYPHFMEKPKKSYHSRTALGKIYDKIRLVDFSPDYGKPFDSRILDSCQASEETLHQAALIKAEYDEGIRRIMTQHEIKWELEVWSTYVLHHKSHSNDYKFHEEIGRLSSSLKEAIRNKCFEHVGGREYEKIAPFVAAMYKITSLQVQDALSGIKERPVPRQASLPFISFPWIFSTILGDLATGRIAMGVDEAIEKGFRVTIPGQDTAVGKTKGALIKSGAESMGDDTSTTREASTTHRGEVLELFDHSGGPPNESEEVENLLVFEETDKLPSSRSSSEPSKSISGDLPEDNSKEVVDGGGELSGLEIGVERSIDGSESLLERLARMHGF